MTDICYVRSDVKCHSLSYWSIICHDIAREMFHQGILQTGKKCPLKWDNQPGLLESLVRWPADSKMSAAKTLSHTVVNTL